MNQQKFKSTKRRLTKEAFKKMNYGAKTDYQ